MVVILLFIMIGSVLGSYFPVIGVLGNPIPYNTGDMKSDYVEHTYVKWLESLGGKVVVIHPWHTHNQIDEIMSNINGILFQGGDRNLSLSNPFEQTAWYIFNKTIEYNSKGNYLPLWATCQGFELVHSLLMNKVDLPSFDAYDYPSPIILTNDTSRMYQYMTKEDLHNIRTKNIITELHNYGINEIQYKTYPILDRFFKITSFAYDRHMVKYVASAEARDYPIYAVQYHPEEVPFDKYDPYINVTYEAIRVQQALGNFFVNEARKNLNKVEDRKDWDYIDSNKVIPDYYQGSYYYIFYNKIYILFYENARIES